MGIKGNWKKYFTPLLLARAFDYFGDTMIRFNYSPVPEGLSEELSEELAYKLSEGWGTARQVLDTIFPNQPDAALRKEQVLYDLSFMAKDGALVELGVAQGRGVIAMALGARDGNGCEVVAVDDYQVHQDWANNIYTDENLTILLQNANRANVEITVVCKDAVEAGKEWNRPVALWCWDVSTNAEDLMDAWLAWYPHIQVGGVAFVRDLYDHRFHSGDVSKHAMQYGFVVELEEPGILLLRKVDKE